MGGCDSTRWERQGGLSRLRERTLVSELTQSPYTTLIMSFDY
jgi:hypothetical protein